ncbi:MAG TPA: lytic murein transglycosylase [Syntrophales bacterium]|nr:lytic murein transglycosylase [Syntrophales bacterium]
MACHLYSWILGLLFSAALVICPSSATADWTPLIERLVADKFDELTVKKLFAQPGVQFDPGVMSCKLKELIRNRLKKHDAAYTRKLRAAYARFLRPEMIAGAHSYAEKNNDTLQKIDKEYCVPKEVVISILLVETELGRNLGDRSAFITLASMALSSDLESIRPYLAPNLITKKNEAFAKQRCREKAEWAYEELKALIRYATERGIDPLIIPGSLYGAIGLCQFMPSKIPEYGVDADKDGFINLFSEQDALYSVANYLSAHGWGCGISMKKQRQVILAYNYSDIYVSTVLNVARKLKQKSRDVSATNGE